MSAPGALRPSRNLLRQNTSEADAALSNALPTLAGVPVTVIAGSAANTSPERSWHSYLALGALAVLLHGAAMLAYIKLDRDTPARPLKQTVEIELIRPVIIPPMEVEPPPPPPPPPPRKEVPPPPPPVLRQTLPPPAPAPEPEPAPIEEIVAEEVLTIPLREDPPPPLPPTSTEEPVSEATAYAGYLRNPAPTYPAFAQRQRWEGTVLIRVHVLASGKPDKLEITQSSGRKTLDDAALAAVRNWTFVPAKRGSKAIDGWTTVPIEFRLSK